MAIGDRTLTNIGTYSVSGSALKTAVETINFTPEEFISGSRIHMIPIENGQVQLITEEVLMA